MYDIEGYDLDIEGEDWEDGDLEGEDWEDGEVLGAEPDDVFLMGRRRYRPRSRSRSRYRRPSRRRPSTSFKGQASGVALTAPSKARILALGFDSVATIGAGAQATVNSQPQVVFRPDRLIVPNSVAPSFLINDLKIGKNSMFISATAVPAQAFSHDASGVGMKMDTAQVSQIISMTVTNISAGALRFIATLTGPSVE